MDALLAAELGKNFMHAFQAALRDVVILASQRSEEHYKGCQEVHGYIDTRIDEALSRISQMDDECVDDRKQVRIIDELVKSLENKLTLRYLILSIFKPAHDNVAVALSNAFFHLARNPDCWKKLRAEIPSKSSQPFTYEQLRSFTYLNWVLRESQCNAQHT